MHRFAVATTVVAFLATGMAEAQMKSAVPPGAKPPTQAPVTNIVKAPEAPLESARRMTREEAIKLVNAKKAVWVDVRSKVAYDEGHIKGSINIPVSEIIARIKEIPPGKFIITYCA